MCIDIQYHVYAIDVYWSSHFNIDFRFSFKPFYRSLCAEQENTIKGYEMLKKYCFCFKAGKFLKFPRNPEQKWTFPMFCKVGKLMIVSIHQEVKKAIQKTYDCIY